ncbi:MAG TPA: hypothetical protein VLH40_07105 [Atribacteraceae bacterium]|nr:hypothetical protein [Atribacteraceae bacterium]
MERKNTGPQPGKSDPELQLKRLRLVREEYRRVPSGAGDFGVPENNLYRWVQQQEQDSLTPFSGAGQGKPPKDEELPRLPTENRDRREEREILKKALAVFSWTKR